MEFKESMFLPTATLAVGMLCPNQRRMPQVGSLLAEAISMAVLIVRLPLVIIVASPVMMQLLTGPCYLDSKFHSLLMNCGQELFSLEDFFNSVYACNGHFWRTFAIVGNFLPPGFAQTFLNGLTTMGENSGMSSFLPGIAGILSKLSANDPAEGVTKLQDVVAGEGRFGPMAMFMKTSLNPIASAHWMWRMASRIVVQIIQATQGKRSIGSVFWNVLYEGRADYEALVAKRLYNTCGGFALLAGYGGPMAQMILHYCNAGVRSTIATLDLVSVFTVDLPIIACVCKEGTGNQPSNWILKNCESPDGLKPLLRTLMDSPSQCADLLTQTTANLTGVFDDTMGELFAGTTYVGSILDSFLSVVDGNKAGQCDNFDTNPYVVTLIPEPADYWRACGKTDFCRLRCRDQIQAFEEVKPSAAMVRSVTTQQTVQSLFFPKLDTDAYNPFSSVVAISEMSQCPDCAHTDDRCFMSAGFVGTGGVLRVAQFCVPSSLSSGVSKSGQWDTYGIAGTSVDVQFIRISTSGGWRDTYAVVGMQDGLMQICARLACVEFTPTDVDLGVLGFQQLQVIGDVAIIQVRTGADGDTTYCLRFQSQQWGFARCESNVWDQTLYHLVLTQGNEQVLLLPYDEVPMQICDLERGISLTGCFQYQGFDRQNVPVKTRGIQSRVSQFASVNYQIFVASNDASHWLTMIKVNTQGTYASASIGNAMQVTMQYTLQQGCSLDSCTGCTSLLVQRLCFAAQRCQVARCIGSQVNQLRPLCAIGGSVEATLFAWLSALHGLWEMISSVLVAVLDASGGISPPKSIKWPDQAFFGLVCSLKDVTASQVSIVTSAINGIIQASMPIADLAAGEATDNNFLATFTLTIMAITKFLYQIALYPLYVAMAVQKIFVCQTNSLIGAATGNNAITIGDPALQSASNAAAGVCMAQVHTENAQSLNNGMDSNKAFVSGSTQVISQLGGLALQMPLDMIVHPIDVAFTYILGIVIGLQDVLQTADQKNCRAPDWTTRVLYRCPCGDQPVEIPSERRAETYLDGAYWCSTTMTMLDFDGSVRYIWNPFSMSQLKERLGDFNGYLDCVASKNDGSCTAPTDPIFQKQQISLLSVYQRCLSNYQAMVWDQGAFVMFNKTLQKKLRLDGVMPTDIPDAFNVSTCLLTQKSSGYDNTGCLTDYFLRGTRSIDYFGYSNITDTTNPTSDRIDACLTFSGPASSPDPAVSGIFMACLENDVGSTGCDIPSMLWSGRSTNRIPVASQHALNISDPAKKKQLAQGEINSAQANVLAVLDKLEKEWTGDGLKITIFSSEGDLLHQYADCVMQGPMSSVVLTPGPDGVEKVIWSRNSAGLPNRSFEIPCSGQRLANRDGERDDAPPYTCGTYARRAVMKHFLRKTYGGGAKYNEGAKDAVVKAVKKLINETREAWSTPSNFLCTCPNGSTTGWECCSEQSSCSTEPCPCGDGYEVAASVACCQKVCPGLAGAGIMQPFSSIKGSSMSADLLDAMGTYLRNDIWVSNDPWLLYDPMGSEAYQNSWSESAFDVTDAGLFDAAKPIVYYDEAKYPFKSTFWEHCTGLLQQVIWTMPLDRNTDRPKGLTGVAFDPMRGQSGTPNLTYTEDFIVSLTREAYRASPLYWHYNVRHTPSQSEVCRRGTPRPPLNGTVFPIGKQSAPRMGFSSMTLGGLGGADCYCGWWYSPATCRIPDTVCGAMVQILGFSRICVQQRQLYNSSDHRAVLGALETLLRMQPSTTYPCPMLQISEHWGFMDSTSGLPLTNATDTILHEGMAGFRVGNVDWLFSMQTSTINPSTRNVAVETSTLSESLPKCEPTADPSIADHFIDELFPAAQGVRQSLPQSYCMRYGIELARLTVYKTMGIDISEQQGVVTKWRARCQYKLEELAICNTYRVYNATGGPQDTTQCPFTLSVIAALQSTYAVTPGCLLIIWNTQQQQDGIYDPCICVPCVNAHTNIDVPAQLTTMCKLESLQTLVASDVIAGENQYVPIGSGSFKTLMMKNGFAQVNTPDITHWALHTSIRDADMILDWWPDTWNHPTGYHVTPGCSRPGDSHWKTFDASWRWENESMVLSSDETQDAYLARNAFGAAGVCRSNNYGMPIVNLNTMAVCTKENANARADPLVPGNVAPPWQDGTEYCASDATQTPWRVNRAVNPPRQWTVGTLQQEAGLQSFTATEWGPNCGPYPLRTCITSGDCPENLICVSNTGGSGICAAIQSGVFECTSHAQCGNDKLCAGDGLCVDGVWQIQNTLQEPVSFRSYSQNCPTGNALDTWGTSIAEDVPDILNASGTCSYRAWFENRRMAARNWCEQADTCSPSGLQPWNFSSPSRHLSDAGKSAFESKVLKVKAHACDRDYQYYASFVSCTPNDNFVALFDAQGNPVNPSLFSRDNRTRTYRVGKRLPLLHHMDAIHGPTYGFTGIPQTYAQLGLGTKNPAIVSCSSLKLCSLQPLFRVNGQQTSQRLVVDSGVVRGYVLSDLLSCGVFGIFDSATGTCKIDYAVAPLAYLVLKAGTTGPLASATFKMIRTTLGTGSYTPARTQVMLQTLLQLPDLFLSQYIGGPPINLDDYLTKCELFVALYQSLSAIPNRPTYDEAGTPAQIYYLTQYGAYEVSFAWWFKCAWLGGFPMGADPIEESLCKWNQTAQSEVSTLFDAPDTRLTNLFNMKATPKAPAGPNATLSSLLIQIPGILTRKAVNQALNDYKAARNAWLDMLYTLLQPIRRECFQQKMYKSSYSDRSVAYQLQRMSQFYDGPAFDSTLTYTDANNITVCTGSACLESTLRASPVTSNLDIAKAITEHAKASIVSMQAISMSSTAGTPDKLSTVPVNRLFTAASIDTPFWEGLISALPTLPNGCSQPISSFNAAETDKSCLCTDGASCSPDILATTLRKNQIDATPQPTVPPMIHFSGTGIQDIAIDACRNGNELTIDGQCIVIGNSWLYGLNFSQLNTMSVPVGVNSELYFEFPWQCVELSCQMNPDLNGTKVNKDFIPYLMTTRERLVINEYDFTQLIPEFKFAPWTSASDKQREQLCSANSQRFANARYDPLTEKYYPDDGSGSCKRKNYYVCNDTCPIPQRIVGDEQPFRLRTRVFTYSVNNSQLIQAEMYPCIIQGSIPPMKSNPSFSFPTARASELKRVWTINTPGVMDFGTANPYSDDDPKFKLKTCGVDNLPAKLDWTQIRSISYSPKVPLSKRQTHLDRINALLPAVNGITTDDCLKDGQTCDGNFDTTVAKLSTVAWTRQNYADQCEAIKNDPYFGCMMFPGEGNFQLLANDETNDYKNLYGNCYPSVGDPDFFCKLHYTTGNEYQTKDYYLYNSFCMSNNIFDQCRSVNSMFRNMNLTGRTLTYNAVTTSPDCKMGPVSQCTLQDELAQLDNVLFACPGFNHSTSRYQGYMNLLRLYRLNTQIQMPYPALMGAKTATASAKNLVFNHIYAELDPRFRCCHNCEMNPPACPTALQVRVEMRKDLWACLDCPLVTGIQCKGIHNCTLTSPNIPMENLNTLDGWESLSAAQKAFLTYSDGTPSDAMGAIDWLLNQVNALSLQSMRLPYEIPAFMTSAPYIEYNPQSVIKHDQAMQLNADSCGTIEGQQPDFTNCSHDSHRRNLKQFTKDQYKVDDGFIVTPGDTLQWKVTRTQLIAQNIPHWELVTPARVGLFLQDLFDDKWCMAGNVIDNACYLHTTASGGVAIDVLNPGMLGAFEPSIGCDTTIINNVRVIDAACYDCDNPEDYVAIENAESMTCPRSYTTASGTVTTNTLAESNLCAKAPPIESSCKNQHGMLQAQNDGRPVGDTYEKQTWVGGLPAGLYSNPLFQSKAPTSGPSNLALSPRDIGGHYIRMGVVTTRGGAYTLAIQAMPLGSYSDALGSVAYSLGLSSNNAWVRQMNPSMETDNLRTLYPSSVCKSWDCPLRRRAFYMGADANFRPSVPDPLRTQILYGTRAHPTQKATPMPMVIDQTTSAVLGVFYTSNGFCACMVPPCNCATDIPALVGQWTSSAVIPTHCNESLDWPHVGGVLRDGSFTRQRWSRLTPCGILDRLPTFQYRYANLMKNVNTVQGKTTLDVGGVCHMGWPVVATGPLGGCYIIGDTDTFMCPTFLQPKNVTRLRAKRVAEMLSARTRPRLSDCNPPPIYRFGNGTPTAPEVSYGMLKRLEAARMLASDLRRRLCGNSTVCKPAAQWSLPSFWSTVFAVDFPSIPSGNGANQTLWSQPWVTCLQNGTCEGRIDRAQWATGDRTAVCRQTAVSSSLAESLAQDIDVCNLDSQMDKFCRTVQDARYRVFEANCLYSGQCRQKLFFYQPSTYEIDNGEFVRSTVQKFYNSTVRGACVPDQDTTAAILANAQNLDNCAATKLNVIVDCIQLVRVIIGSLVELMYYSGQLLLTVFQLLGAKNDVEKRQLTTQIDALLALIANKFIVLFNEIGDLFYKILFEGPMGSWLNSLIQSICHFIEWLFSKVVYLVLCFVRYAAVFFLDTVANGIVDIINAVTFGKLGYLHDQISSAKKSVEDNIQCSDRNLWSCNLPFRNDNNTVTTLPLPTRCWAGVEPGRSSLACTAADTCIQTNDFSKVICGACPMASAMTQFGCDSLTKLCTCSVFPVGISGCSSHEECSLDDVSCQFVDSYLKPSYGNVPCNRCQKPMCLVTAGASMGQCSCLLRPIPIQPCTGVGQRVSPDATRLCLAVTSGSSGSSNAYTQNYRTLVSAPCMLLNQGQTYCMTVYTSASVSLELVVGMSLLSTRRRLLEASNMTSAVAVWEGTSEPCRSLAAADKDQLGVLERYTLSECWRWYEIGVRLTTEANMTKTVSPFLLVSWQDLLHTMLDNGAMIEIMAKLPAVVHHLLLHWDMAQPIYLIITYWLQPNETIWHNQTILDQMAHEFERNFTSSSHQRRLLQSGRTLQSTTVITTTVTSETVAQWDQGPYAWPPNFVYWSDDTQACAVVSMTLEVFKNGLDSTIAYYKSEHKPPSPVIWPSLPIKLSTPNISLSTENGLLVLPKAIMSNLTNALIDREAVKAILSDASYMDLLKSFVLCNFTRVQMCDQRREFMPGVLQFLLLGLILSLTAHVLGIPYVDTILLLCVVPVFLYATYGYSPTCAPLIPTCLFSDVLDVFESVLPSSITWPEDLVTVPNCASVSCLRSCTEDPIIGFNTWNDHLAWFLCEIVGKDQAVDIANTLQSTIGDESVRTSILRKCNGSPTAQRICFALTFVDVLPLVLVVYAILRLLGTALRLAFIAVQLGVNMMFALVLFTHHRPAAPEDG